MNISSKLDSWIEIRPMSETEKYGNFRRISDSKVKSIKTRIEIVLLGHCFSQLAQIHEQYPLKDAKKQAASNILMNCCYTPDTITENQAKSH